MKGSRGLAPLQGGLRGGHSPLLSLSFPFSCKKKRRILTMNRFLGWFAVVVCVLLFAGMTQAYDVMEVKDASTIKGVVKYAKTSPKDDVINVTKDEETCGKTQELGEYLITDMRVKNAVVWLENVKSGKPLSKAPVDITFKKCKVDPLVSVGFVGGQYVFKNEDPLLHTIQLKLGLQYQKKLSGRPLTEGSTILNLALADKGTEIKKPIKDSHRYTKETGFITVRSNAHDWIRGYVFVFDQPYAAVTNDKGEFEFDGLPAGEYILNVWHEGLGTIGMPIRTIAGQTSTVETDLATKDKQSAQVTAQAAPQVAPKAESPVPKADSPKIEFKETRYEFGSTEQKRPWNTSLSL
ncbi:lipoprotein [Candidatus Magnetobacterium bavaricum]|uniref:Lipoprotein n=1 Tax=Candidatus Magnetobacterium bavaricum TaxID=29290 RepID=A0A0F3GSM7_9BACT|nr:lipoprotein [Candidatus Magnetobacterium bavaricum]